jgi:hypothetical protein
MIKHISFDKSDDIFGTGFDRLKSDECKIFSKLLPHINGKGRPIIETIVGLDKKYLWAYIYYLAKHNVGFAYLSKIVHEGANKAIIADANALVTVVCEFLGKPVDESIQLETSDLAQFVVHLWDFGSDQPPFVPYLNNIYAFVLEKLKTDEKNTGQAYEQLQESVEHVKQLTSQLREMRRDGSIVNPTDPPKLIVSPRGEPYEMMSRVNLEVVVPKPT